MIHEVFKNIGQTTSVSLKDLDGSRGLASNEEEAKVDKAVVEFFRDMINIDGVEAVAFSLVEDSPAPASTSTLVFAPLEIDDEKSSNIVDKSTDAHLKLDMLEVGNEYPIFRGGLRFWNTKNTDLVDAEKKFRDNCKRDKTCELVGIFVFKRNVLASL